MFHGSWHVSYLRNNPFDFLIWFRFILSPYNHARCTDLTEPPQLATHSTTTGILLTTLTNGFRCRGQRSSSETSEERPKCHSRGCQDSLRLGLRSCLTRYILPDVGSSSNLSRMRTRIFLLVLLFLEAFPFSRGTSLRILSRMLAACFMVSDIGTGMLTA